MLRILFVLSWAGLIFILTCTSSLEKVMETHKLYFHWNSEPVILEILEPLPNEVTLQFIHQKIGHVLVFFILTIGVYCAFPFRYVYGVFPLIYALLTEVLQLFFMRDGRFFDVAFDSGGIFVAILIIQMSKCIHKINGDAKV